MLYSITEVQPSLQAQWADKQEDQPQTMGSSALRPGLLTLHPELPPARPTFCGQ